MITKAAHAKINLALHVTGVRGDGYHMLDSLVAFADIGDVISVEPADTLTLQIKGPYGDGLACDDTNLVLKAARFLSKDKTAKITLTKNLPLASGIGGGSADAAATLRALAQLWDIALPEPSSFTPLGADVPVCLHSKPSRMMGIGERIETVPSLPQLHCVLINPNIEVPTPAVFKALACKDNAPLPDVAGDISIQLLKTCRNDLEGPACSIAPVITQVLDALRKSGCDLARMSGSGATCFGLYPNAQAASIAAKTLANTYPDWWIKATVLRGS